MDVEEWLHDGEAPEADWGGYVLKRALRGELGDGGEDLLLDLPALTAPYGCRSGACTPGRRTPKARSCCADLEVGLTGGEIAAIVRALPEIAPHLSEDARWAAGAPALFDDGALRRPGRRCVFAVDRGDGLVCALQLAEAASARPAGSLKPMPCRLFPLSLVDLGDGRLMLTAIHRDTARMLDSRPARVFPCLGEGEPLYVAERAVIEAALGAEAWARIDAAARA